MNTRQKNKLNMFHATEEICDLNTATWTPITAYGAAFVLFQGKVRDIESLQVKQEADLKGIKENKDNKKSSMISKTLSVSKPMIAFANVTNNPQLRQEVDYSETDLFKSADSDLEARCKLIHQKADANSAALVGYGVTALMITGLDTAITDFHEVISGPRSAEAVKKQQTAEIEVLIKETDQILKGQLDPLMVLFESSAPEFYGAYKNARIIVDLGGHVNTFTGSVAPSSMKNILNTATDDEESFEISNTGSVPLEFGRGAASSEFGGEPVKVEPGITGTYSALELGPTGNKYLNVKNGSAEEGSYKVVRI